MWNKFSDSIKNCLLLIIWQYREQFGITYVIEGTIVWKDSQIKLSTVSNELSHGIASFME